jgi:hypothetical protein
MDTRKKQHYIDVGKKTKSYAVNFSRQPSLGTAWYFGIFGQFGKKFYAKVGYFYRNYSEQF